MSVLYNINFIPAPGSDTLVEYRVETDMDWTTPSSPANPTSLFTYPLTLLDDSVYYVRVSSISSTCSPQSRIIFIDTSTESGTTTTTTTTSTSPGGDLVANLSRSGSAGAGTLFLEITGGTPPYNYGFGFIVTSGACHSATIFSPTGTTPDEATTTYSATLYAGTTYKWYANVADSASHVVTSNLVTNPSCLVPETHILMRDFSSKQLGTLVVGDKLFDDNTVMGFGRHIVDKLYIINKGLLKASEGHVHILKGNTLAQSYELEIGEYLVDKFGLSVRIESIDIEEGEFEVINIETSNKTYIANSMLTHNKLEC